MPLVCIFDSVTRNSLKYTTDYLTEKFADTRVISYDPDDTECESASNVSDAIELAAKLNADIVLTNHLPSVPQLTAKLPTIVWLTDRTGSLCSKRQENIVFWRQMMGLLRSVDCIYAASQFMAKQVLDNYRVPCKVQPVYIPPQNGIVTKDIVYYNEPPAFLDNMKELVPDQKFAQLEKYDDFKSAKLYIHRATGLEYANIEVPIASTYGIPSMVENYGCLSEYVIAGNKLLPLGSDQRTWVQTFKIMLRDRDINAETVRKLSYRYTQMSEFEERIKAVLKKKMGKLRRPSFQEVQDIAKGRTRPAPPPSVEKKQPIKPKITYTGGLPQNDVDHVKEFLAVNDSVYFGCGGLGDALLVIASCYQDSNAKVIFGSNHATVRELFEAFKIPVLTTRNFYPSIVGSGLHQYIITHSHFKGSAHIPDSMNYGEWIVNPQKYLNRINKKLPTKDIFGTLVNPRDTTGVIGLSPRGSDHHSTQKQRYLTQEEFNKLARKFLDQNLTVIAFGSPQDVEYYKVIKNNNFMWMTSEFGISYPAPQYPMTMRHMLSAVNCCDQIISVDTWLKTYGGLAGIPTKVVMSRRNGVAIKPPQDSSDHIFMDTSFWGFDLIDIAKFLS